MDTLIGAVNCDERLTGNKLTSVLLCGFISMTIYIRITNILIYLEFLLYSEECKHPMYEYTAGR